MQSPTVDPREVVYYERLAEEWWNRHGKFWPLHRLNELRREYLKQEICRHFDRDPVLAQPLGGLNVIDIGCGGGILSESMAALGANVHGIDVVEKNILVARQHNLAQEVPIEYEYASVESIAARPRKYDIVLNMEVVEHVADLPEFLSSCSALLDDNGIMFIATINRNPISWLTAIIGAEYILGWLPKGTHTWRKFVKPEELEQLLARDRIRVNDTTGVHINPLTRQFSLSRSLRVNYMLCANRERD